MSLFNTHLRLNRELISTHQILNEVNGGFRGNLTPYNSRNMASNDIKFTFLIAFKQKLSPLLNFIVCASHFSLTLLEHWLSLVAV